MKTNFFTLLQQSTIQHVDFSIAFNNDTCTLIIKSNPVLANDEATKTLKPIVVTEKTEKLDKEFFNLVQEQLNKNQTFFSNVETIEKDRAEKEKQTKHAKEQKELYNKKFKQLQELTEDKEFNPKDLEQKNKALKIVEAILKIKDKCPKTLEIKNQIIAKASEQELF